MRKLCFVLTLLMIFSTVSVFAADSPHIVSISLSENCSTLVQGQSVKLSAAAVMSDGSVSVLANEDVKWDSSDSQIISVDSEGVAAARGSGGFSVISAEKGGKIGRIILHSSDKYMINHGFEADKYSITKGSEYFARLSGTQKHSGETSLEIYNDTTISFKRYDLYQNPGKNASVREAWFYDDGRRNGSGPSVYFQDSKNLVMISAGVLNTASSYYTYANPPSARKNYGSGGTAVSDESGYLGTEYTSASSDTSILRTKGWHQVTLSVKPLGNYDENIATENGIITLYIDGTEVFSDRYLPFPVHVVGFKTAENCDFFYDDPCMYKNDFDHMPYVKSIDFIGGFVSGETLSANISAEDPDGEDITDIHWLWEQSEDKVNWEILGESENIRLTDENIGKFIRCTAAAESQSGRGEPFAVVTPYAVEAKYEAPTVSNPKIFAADVLGGSFYADYDYSGKNSDNSRIIWQISEDKAVWEDCAETNELTAAAWMNGKYIRAKIIPRDSHNFEGAAVITEAAAVEIKTVEYYVGSGGSDENGGSAAAPFKTLQKAITAAREERKHGFDGEIGIILKGEKFYIDKPLNLTAKDYNLRIASETGERSELTGGVTLEQGRIKRVQDPEILGKIKDKSAREKLMEIDLNGIVDEIPEIGSFVHGKNNGNFDSQIRVCVNGVPLEYARWPNERENDLKITSSVLDEAANIYSVSYGDASERAKTWSEESKNNLYISGHFWISWANAFMPTGNFDAANRAFSVDASLCSGRYVPTAGDEFYFFNLPEEIDMPGECFVDRKNMKIYYYPSDNSVQSVVVPVSKNRIINADSVRNIRFENIDFTYVRKSVFSVLSSENVIFDGCRFLHFTASNTLSGNYNTVKNCYFYDGGQGGIAVYGGDTKKFTGGKNVIENNIFNSMDCLKQSYSPAVRMGGYNQIVRKNEIYNSYHQVMTMSGNDHIIEYNDIHDTTRWTGDMGAIYWLSGPSSIGHEIRYNYFHDNGSSYFGGWSQCIFWDDCEIGPHIYGNVFARSNSEVGEGENPGNRYAVKANGGNFAVVENNIFADCPTPAQFQNNEKYRNESGSRKQQICFWLRMYGKSKYSNSAWWEDINKSGYFSDEWKEHYRGTVWEDYVNMCSLDFYEENLASLDPEKDEDTLVEIARKYAPESTNRFSGNVVYNKYSSSLASGSNGVEENTYVPESPEVFADYENDNFELTEKALSEFSGFKNVDMSDFGPDNKQKIVCGDVPKADNAEISGVLMCGEKAGSEYDYTSEMPESMSLIKWYVSDNPDSGFEFLGLYGKEIYIPDDFEGKYIKFSVQPKSELGISGDTVFSKPMIVSKTYGVSVKNMVKSEGVCSFELENKRTDEISVMVISEDGGGFRLKRITLPPLGSENVSINADSKLYIFKSDNLAPLWRG